MANALKGTPESWVRLDRKAKAPVNRTKVINQDLEEVQEDHSSPPMATPLYRPAPVVIPRREQNDFEDLPGEELTVPSETPATQEQPLQPKKTDSLDSLIEQVQ